MKKKLFIQLLLFFTSFLTLYSCIHDDMNTASDLSSKGYENKSLWKQDEKYIKNVMQVYQENEDKIKKTSGTPYWDYASTLESFDETFVMVPIVEAGRVVSVMQVPRHGSKIRFYYTNFQNQIDFFQALIFAKYKKIIPLDTSETDKTIVCKTETVSVWLPDSESNPDPGSGAGHWGVHSVIKCKQVLDNCSGVVGPNGECITGGNGGDPEEFPYPGGGGNSEKTPCEKVKTIGKSTRAKEIFKELKGKTTGTTAEHAYTFSDDGGIINENHIVGIPGSKEVNLPISSPIDAYIHSHYQGLLSIFSVSDIFALASIYKNGKIKDTETFVIGVVTASGTQYMMIIDDVSQFVAFADSLFTGNQIDADALNAYENIYSLYNISTTNTPAINEVAFVKYIEKNATGLKVLKGNASFSNWGLLKKDSNGNIVTQNCP